MDRELNTVLTAHRILLATLLEQSFLSAPGGDAEKRLEELEKSLVKRIPDVLSSGNPFADTPLVEREIREITSAARAAAAHRAGG